MIESSFDPVCELTNLSPPQAFLRQVGVNFPADEVFV